MSNTEKVNILLVDDRPENLLAMEVVLEHRDYNIVKASSGEEALKYVVTSDCALILLDVQMSKADGYEIAKVMKAGEKTRHVPILFIVDNELEAESLFISYPPEVIDYVARPINPFLLKAKVGGFAEKYRLSQKIRQLSIRLEEKNEEVQKLNAALENSEVMLQKSEALAKVICETSIFTMINMNEEGTIFKVNPAVSTMFGYKMNEVLGENISMLFSSDIGQILQSVDGLEAIIGPENNIEIIAARKDGTHFPAELQIGKRVILGEQIIAVFIRDISIRKKFERALSHMAYHDWLTDLPNRRSFTDRLPAIINSAKHSNEQFALLYIDIDHLKYINDSLGHIIGDEVIREFSQILTQCIRKEDFISRIGGDEFNIILHNTNREQAIDMAETILERFTAPIYVDTYELFITACIGISIFPFDGEETGSLMRNADAALYRAKQQGNHNYKMFHSGINIQSYRSFILRNDIHKAIGRNELKLMYQPRIDIESGRVTGAEALLRWEHPDWGIISPKEFIPLAEENGRIVELGSWVIDAVCSQMKEWKEEGLSIVRVAVNLSGQQFLQKDLVKTVARLLEEKHISPAMLEVEINETVIMANEPGILKTLNQLKEEGIWISIDDFGTGYSSLSYLRSLPVRSLKIDESFIQDAPNCIPLISSIISLAKSMDMTVVAEGVETEEQLNIIAKLGCGEFQGYFVSPPVFPEEFNSFLIEKRPVINQSGVIEPAKKKKAVHVQKLNEKLSPDISKDILAAALKRIKDTCLISAREMDVFKLIVEGLSNREISERLFISEHTVKNHITHIFQKLDVNDRLQAMAKVYQACIEEGKHY